MTEENAEQNNDKGEKPYKVEFDRPNCIGAGVCAAVAPEDWEMDADGKANLIGSKEENGKFVKEINESALEANKQAADGCPVQIIKVFNKKNEQIK